MLPVLTLVVLGSAAGSAHAMLLSSGLQHSKKSQLTAACVPQTVCWNQILSQHGGSPEQAII